MACDELGLSFIRIPSRVWTTVLNAQDVKYRDETFSTFYANFNEFVYFLNYNVLIPPNTFHSN